jgi:hypothetical protein
MRRWLEQFLGRCTSFSSKFQFRARKTLKLLCGLMGATLLLEAPLLLFYPLGDRTELVAFQVAGTYAYWWPRPGSDKPLEKTSFYTKVGDQICGVGYYK